MSLKDAVLDIAEQMEDDTKHDECDREHLIFALKMHSRMLRMAVKAAGNPPVPQPMGFSGIMHNDALSPLAQHAAMVDKAREEFRAAKKQGDMQESLEPIMREIADGPEKGDMVACDAIMPPLAKMILSGRVYQLRDDGKLWPWFEPVNPDGFHTYDGKHD